MSTVVPNLVSLKDYQVIRAHLFPSIESTRWFVRKHRRILISSGALLEIAGRSQVSPQEFDEVVLFVGKQAAMKGQS